MDITHYSGVFIVDEKQVNECLCFRCDFRNFVKLNDLTLKLFARLRLEFSHLNEHKFKHGFGDTVSPMFGCNAEIENANTSSCVTIFILQLCLLKHSNSSIILTKLTFFSTITQLGNKEHVNILLCSSPPDKSNS